MSASLRINLLTYENLKVAQISHSIIAEFFAKSGISMRAWKPSSDRSQVEQRVRKRVSTWDFGDISPARVERHTVTSINMAVTTFDHTHPDVQIHIALFTVLGLCIDDLEIGTGALEEFVHRLHTSTPQLHPVLDLLVKNMQELPKYFPPYAAAAIYAAIVQFVNSTFFDKQSECMTLTAESLPYVLYKRARNSLGEVYGFFVWDKYNFPDVSVHIQVIA